MKSWKVWIDTGGTFTDCIATDPEGQTHYVKVLSNSSLRGTIKEVLSTQKIRVRQNWGVPDHLISGLSFNLLETNAHPLTIEAFNASESTLRFKEEFFKGHLRTGLSFEILSDEEAPVLACRLATKTPAGEKMPAIDLRLATTKGTNALLEQNGAPTLLLMTRGLGDLLYIGDQKRPDLFALNIKKPIPLFDEVLEVQERLDADGKILLKPNFKSLLSPIRSFLKQKDASVAICLMHSYKNNCHEKELQDWLFSMGANFISCSSDMSRSIKLLPRAQTTVINAYLEPILDRYFRSVKSVFPNGNIFIMNSAAGLTSSENFNPKDGLLSGPAGGVIGAAETGRESGRERIISLDMGGTSTDVARYDGAFDYQFEHSVGEANIKAPALAIETVAAGGGSICSYDGQKLTVGPDSAGAHPGPACYNAGGPLTLTDVNLLLGRLRADNFNIPISEKAANRKLEALVEIIEGSGKPANRNEILEGLLQIANERMADAIKKVSLRKGYDPSDYSLVAFGGAGAQHAIAIASLLGISTVLIPEKAGLLSANGLGNATIEVFEEQQILEKVKRIKKQLPSVFKELGKKATDKLYDEIPNNDKLSVTVKRRMAFMRLAGQEVTIEIPFSNHINLRREFKKAYQKRYGHWVHGRDIEIESVRLVAAANPERKPNKKREEAQDNPKIRYHAKVQYGREKHSTPIYHRSDLKFGHSIQGPAIILDPYSTTVVEPTWSAQIEENGTIRLNESADAGNQKPDDYSETINLELFTNRFTSIAEEMGEMMRRTALSVNVKERLDFSCALLNARGELVVNAPHIPVHLGALGLCVRRLKQTIPMEPGDVVVTNHPLFGGSHLPDITVVTPIYDENESLLGYAACRAHHAEIGGTRPGSMPPDATSLSEEGVVIPPTYLIKSGDPKWEKIEELLSCSPYPSRAVKENVADLHAAVAADHRGSKAIIRLAKSEGKATVRHYMEALKSRAAQKAVSMIKDLPDLKGHSEEYLDDGTKLSAFINKKDGKLEIDFSNSSGIHPGNLNATPAIVQSVVMYVLRCLIEDPLPLNEGLLDPVNITLPTGILNPNFGLAPEECPAVVGGNTETSQRLVDLLLKPFEKMACSQGTMNNVLFGNESFGYYETIGGGTGAGPDFNGADAVHHHMTNTAGTDPEILEFRYPVRLKRYGIRRKSGGTGKHKGGDGIIRELKFLDSVSLSVLTQHRREKPYGLKGGQAGKRGQQFVIRKNGERQSLKPIDGAELNSGDRFVIETPGGGGFGT